MQPAIYLLIGIVVGGLIGWLMGKLLSAKNNNGGELNASMLEQEKLSGKLESLQQEKAKQEKFFQEQIIKTETNLKEERDRNLVAEKKIAQLDAMYKASEEKWNNQKAEIEELQKKSRIEFENIANKLLKEKAQEFSDQNKTQLDIILSPLKEKIVSFEKKVDENYKEEFREKASLKEQIKNLVDLNQKISQEANNLVTALKGSNKTQGNWGEMILERILEVSGLTKDQEYKTQYSSSNEDGKRLQPDVVIMLPDDKNMVIDSKVSLLAYEQFINAEGDDDKQRFLKQHVDSVRAHIRLLGDKNYTELAGVKTPDFILLFVPIEASFAAALQGDPELYNFAWDRKIVLVSPTTLLATLRTVSSVWKQEKQIKNALTIAESAGNMYDKFVAVTEDLLKVGKSIDASKNLYVDAMNKFVEGKGNLIKRAEDLKELGIKTSKNFDPKLIERSNQNLFDNKPEDEK